MNGNCFIKLPVTDLARATAFYQDHGSMFGRSIADPDGHIREFFWMDPAHLPTEQTP